MFNKKRKFYRTADNTVLGCPNVNYKYNKDTYEFEKTNLWVGSFAGLVISIMIIVFCDNGIIQIVAGTFMGGILSMIVWLFTVRHQDKMNYELANIDLHIMKIDEILSLQQSKTKFIDPKDEEIVDCDNENVGLRFLLLLQVFQFISATESIDASALELKFLNNQKLTVEEFIMRSHDILINHEFQTIASDVEWDNLIKWNNWYLDRQLNDLKNKLRRYKYYILCGNAPDNYSELKKEKKK